MKKFTLVFLLIILFANSSQAAWYNQAWNNRIKITVNKSQVNGSVSDFPVYINLDDLPDSFFDNCKNNGSDLRITLGDGSSELAREIVFVDKTANAGELWFKVPSLTSSTNGEFYIYYGNSSASEPGAATTYGFQNVWSNGFVAVYHMNALTNGTASVLDSSSNAYHSTPRGGMSNLTSGVTGFAIDFDGINDFVDTPDDSTSSGGGVFSFDDGDNFSLTVWYKGVDTGSHVLTRAILGRDNTDLWANFGLNNGKAMYAHYTGVWSNNIISTTTVSDYDWHYISFINYSNATGDMYVDGIKEINGESSSFSLVSTRFVANNFMRGYNSVYTSGELDEVRIANKARNNNWIRTEYNNQNYPNTFYTVNGEESNLNANGFPYKIKITINRSQVNGSVTEFPVYVNLENMPAHFFSIVKSNGADIRITQSDLVTRVPVEIVSLNKATSNGELWFRASSLSSTANSDFYLWYGNNGATMPSAKSTHGSQNVWSNGFVAVYHMNAVTNGTASVLDSTSSAYHGRPYGNMSTVTSSKMGNSILFDGTNDYINFGTASLANLTSQMYVSAWIYANAYGVWNGIFTRQNASYDGGWGLVQDYTSILASINFNSGLAEYISVANNPPISTWNYLSTRNFSGTRTLFLNSMAEGTSTIIATSSPSEMVAGRFYFNHNSLFFNGRIDEIRVVNKARANNWIKTEYNNQNSPNTFYSITPINNSNIFWGIAP